jgi:hypothetical protein
MSSNTLLGSLCDQIHIRLMLVSLSVYRIFAALYVCVIRFVHITMAKSNISWLWQDWSVSYDVWCERVRHHHHNCVTSFIRRNVRVFILVISFELWRIFLFRPKILEFFVYNPAALWYNVLTAITSTTGEMTVLMQYHHDHTLTFSCFLNLSSVALCLCLCILVLKLMASPYCMCDRTIGNILYN